MVYFSPVSSVEAQAPPPPGYIQYNIFYFHKNGPTWGMTRTLKTRNVCILDVIYLGIENCMVRMVPLGHQCHRVLKRLLLYSVHVSAYCYTYRQIRH